MKLPKVIIVNKLWGNVVGLSLIFITIVSRRAKNVYRTINHEAIHYRQWLELLIIGFLIVYVFTYFYNIFVKGYSHTPSYLNIPLEAEAHDNDDNRDYLITRKPYAWVKYWSWTKEKK